MSHDTKEARRAAAAGGKPGAGAVAGSATWFDAARGVLYLFRDPHTEGGRMLQCLAVNHGRDEWGADLAGVTDVPGVDFAGYELRGNLDRDQAEAKRQAWEAAERTTEAKRDPENRLVQRYRQDREPLPAGRGEGWVVLAALAGESAAEANRESVTMTRNAAAQLRADADLNTFADAAAESEALAEALATWPIPGTENHRPDTPLTRADADREAAAWRAAEAEKTPAWRSVIVRDLLYVRRSGRWRDAMEQRGLIFDSRANAEALREHLGKLALPPEADGYELSLLALVVEGKATPANTRRRDPILPRITLEPPQPSAAAWRADPCARGPGRAASGADAALSRRAA